jgi:3-hydroxyisobutyrate dehydrogenase-like beta-hydroxyacid dehydrogenase
MIRRLTAAGHSVRALGRNPGTRAAITATGATALGSAIEAGQAAEAVVVCVFTDQQVREVCLDSGLLETMPPGSVLILHTTGSPDTATTIAAARAAAGRHVVDAPVRAEGRTISPTVRSPSSWAARPMRPRGRAPYWPRTPIRSWRSGNSVTGSA